MVCFSCPLIQAKIHRKLIVLPFLICVRPFKTQFSVVPAHKPQTYFDWAHSHVFGFVLLCFFVHTVLSESASFPPFFWILFKVESPPLSFGCGLLISSFLLALLFQLIFYDILPMQSFSTAEPITPFTV